MHIADILARDSMTLSFEFFPPKTDDGWDALFAILRDFEALAPSFVSVTYGAGGSTRDRTHDLVVRLRRDTTLDAIPHLTCVCHQERDVADILARYAKAGVSNILAIRGDPPRTSAGWDPAKDSFRYAGELVSFIRKFNDSGAHPDRRGFGIGVAGFPEGHPETPNVLVQMDHLKAKVDCGIDYVCTQLFFDNRAFYDWRDRCALAGIRVPILAGIMPITSMAGLRRMAELAAGTRFPAPLLRQLHRHQDDPEAVERIGIHWATEQCRDLIDNAVRGIHFYTLNRSEATREIYRSLGARDSSALR